MTNIINKIKTNIALIAAVFAVVSLPVEVNAFVATTYTDNSALAQGNWVKISVTQTGIHFIPAATLRQWGFSDPMKVQIHGYGACMVPDQMTAATFYDDLPQIAVMRTAAGVYFYGHGLVQWARTASHYTQRYNPYSNEGYYFLTEGVGEELQSVASIGQYNPQNPAVTTFNERIFHEKDLVTFSQSGLTLYGEDFRYTKTQKFPFRLNGLVPDTKVWMRTTFGAATTKSSIIDIAVDDEKIASASIDAMKDGFGADGISQVSFTPDGEQIQVSITHKTDGLVSAAHLDAITLNYTRKIKMDGGLLDFEATSSTVALEGATSQTHVWDVTNILKPFEMNTTMASDGRLMWTNSYSGTRRYLAWNENATMLTPKYAGTVANQNIHGVTDIPDMVIFTVADWAGEAERLANIHRAAPDNFNVLVLNQDLVFNEFSSGQRDPGAFRKCLKYFYDRSNAAADESHSLRYAVMFGRATFDNRRITEDFKGYTSPFMPTWQTTDAVSSFSSFTSDDFYGMLDDNTGAILSQPLIRVAVGRIPAQSLRTARDFVDKLIAYNNNSLYSHWKNNVVLEADNGNNGIFMDGTEAMQKNLFIDADPKDFTYNKIYYDAFTIQNGVCSGAIELYKRLLDEGIAWWFYNGHGARETLGGEGLHNKSDIESMYNKRLPILFAATCSFGLWDGPLACGAETMLFNTQGGTIACVTPSRKVYVTDNDILVKELGKHILRRDEQGNYKRLGDMLLSFKNSLRSSNGSNASLSKLRFVTMGDPAMRLTTPSNRMELELINDQVPDPLGDATIMARQKVTFSGSVLAPDGTPIDDFNGQMMATLYDAEHSTTSNGTQVDDTGAKKVTFEEMGQKLFMGRASVVNGQFSLTMNMPAEIADNFREATFNMYAWSDDGREAAGVCRSFFISGYDDTAEADTIPPTIDYAYLNHSSFTNGTTVNESPMFIASVSDDTGINMSSAGIGHQMTLKLDDRRTFSNISLYYSPSSDGSPSGTIAYPITELEAGNHTLTFRVWDTDGNSSSQTLSFFVEPGAAPEMFDVYTDANPASTHANFYISHNRPDAMATVSIEIYDMAGHRIWTATESGRSDMFTSMPIQWNLSHAGGARVPRGIYLYRAILKIDGHTLTSKARRIAVGGY